MEASAAIVKGLSVLPLQTPFFKGYNGFRLKLDMLRFQSVSNLKKCFCGFFFFNLQCSYLAKVRIPETGKKKKNVYLLRKKPLDMQYSHS